MLDKIVGAIASFYLCKNILGRDIALYQSESEAPSLGAYVSGVDPIERFLVVINIQYEIFDFYLSFTVSIATNVEVCATCGSAEMRSPSTRR